MADSKNTKEEGVAVNEGGTYRHNDSGALVVAFYVDRPGSTVRFSPATGATGREDRLGLEEFSNTYTLEANQGEEVSELTEGEPTEAKEPEQVRTTTTTKEQQRQADRSEDEPKTTSRK